MRSQNINYNLSGKVGGLSCLLLLLLTFSVTSPCMGLSAFAEEANGDYEVNAETSGSSTADVGLETYATAASSVNISFSPSTTSSSVTPIDSTDGDKAKMDVQATVRVQNSGGYSVYIGSTSSDLRNGVNTIPSVVTTTTYANLPVNRWGYSFQEGFVVKDSYEAMPATLRSVAKYSNTNVNIVDETKTFMLSFVARIGSDKPAGIYTSEVTMSVVSSPREVAEFPSTLVNMQDMTSTICNDAGLGASKRLKDTRDNKMYWVKKMPDNQCWMVQNLDLDLGTAWPDASKSDYDIATTMYVPTITQTQQTAVDTSQTNTRSWDFGEWVITNPTIASGCGPKQKDLSNCTSQFTNVVGKAPSADPDFYKIKGATVDDDEYDAHYLIGNYYSWNTATAGTGGEMTSGDASGSICPKNWKLPTSNSTNLGSFGGLISEAKIGTNVIKLTGDGYFFVRGGSVLQNADYLFDNAGSIGLYWSSTPTPNSAAYRLFFSGSDNIHPSDGTYMRRNGFSVRCIAR